MKLKATIKYDSNYKLLPHTTNRPFSRNGIRCCFKHKYDFVTSRSTRHVRINRTILTYSCYFVWALNLVADIEGGT
jgi:hypothetical protein